MSKVKGKERVDHENIKDSGGNLAVGREGQCTGSEEVMYLRNPQVATV